MNITVIKTYVMEAALGEPFAYSLGWYEKRGALLIEIIQEGRHKWLGRGVRAAAADRSAPIVDYYRPLLVGADSLATDLLRFEMPS